MQIDPGLIRLGRLERRCKRLHEKYMVVHKKFRELLEEKYWWELREKSLKKQLEFEKKENAILKEKYNNFLKILADVKELNNSNKE